MIFENRYKNEKYSHSVRLAALQSLRLDDRVELDLFRYFWLTLQVCVGKANLSGGAGVN